MKKLLMILLIAMMLQSFAGVVSAEHVEEQDIVVSIDTGLGIEIPLLTETGELSYELQELIHSELLAYTGLEVDHYYIWIEVDGERVLGIDPAAAMF